MIDRSTFKPVRVDVPEAGHYTTKMVRGGPKCPVKIWFGAPLDPVTKEELDRSHRWQALRNGLEIDVWEVWPYCAGTPIDEAEYHYMLDTFQWAVEHSPDSPEAAPKSAINLNTVKPPF